MSGKPAQQADRNSTLTTIIRGTLYIPLVTTIIVLLGYGIWLGVLNNQELSTHSADWGSFGDFFGGILNPIIGVMTLYWVIIAVRYQQEELGQAREALSKSSEAQVKAAHLQRINAALSALTAELSVIQSDIDARRDAQSEIMKMLRTEENLKEAQDLSDAIGKLLESRRRVLKHMRDLIAANTD